MIVAIIALGILAAALLAALIYREQANAADRNTREAAWTVEREHLLRTALAPGAVQAAAYESVRATDDPPKDAYDERVQPSPGFELDDLMEVG